MMNKSALQDENPTQGNQNQSSLETQSPPPENEDQNMSEEEVKVYEALYGVTKKWKNEERQRYD